jgi:hypothetical protein
MSWSLTDVSFRMAGRGDWRRLLPDEASRRGYARAYPDGAAVEQLSTSTRQLAGRWEEAGIAVVEGGRIVPASPIVTDADLRVLSSWFADVASAMADVVATDMPALRRCSKELCASDAHAREANVLTILACAHALDLEAWRHVRLTLAGPHPQRGHAGHFFFWGYAFASGPRHIFGVSTYVVGELRLAILRSHALDRGELPALLRDPSAVRSLALTFAGLDPPLDSRLVAARLVAAPPAHLSVPVFDGPAWRRASGVVTRLGTALAVAFAARVPSMGELLPACTFARARRDDVLAMLFHLAYSYAAGALVYRGLVPPFPSSALGEWGVWAHRNAGVDVNMPPITML